jgi:sugar phosphate isomerase/epimerase
MKKYPSVQPRREFIKAIGLLSACAVGAPVLAACGRTASSENTSDSTAMNAASAPALFFKISLAQWSLHKMLFSKKLDHLDFPAKAKNDFGIDAVEYVNQFFMNKAKDTAYLTELKKRCDDLGVTSVLIMCDGEGEMANTDAAKRMKAVENHYKWVEAAKFLGCHAIRVNCYGVGAEAEVAKAGTDGLRKLSEFARPLDINVIVENHGGYSSKGVWLAGVIAAVGMPNCGTLPDFGNFCVRREKPNDWQSPCAEEYDRYRGVEEMMPFAKGVSAKSYAFDANGNCVETDYARMLPIVKKAGYTGHIGIEYEGAIPEDEGIRATKKLLERLGAA